MIEAACADPECKRGLCREMERQDAAYARERALRSQRENDLIVEPLVLRSTRRRRPYSSWRRPTPEQNARALALGIAVLFVNFVFWLVSTAIRRGWQRASLRLSCYFTLSLWDRSGYDNGGSALRNDTIQPARSGVSIFR